MERLPKTSALFAICLILVARLTSGQTNTPVAPGSCIYLPKGQVHCVENTGEGELRLLGVFYPAGSPSVRYETE
jgi:oxalate decarboxylase/phosphoglucose isomerase-like protein (cupin superfamily)